MARKTEGRTRGLSAEPLIGGRQNGPISGGGKYCKVCQWDNSNPSDLVREINIDRYAMKIVSDKSPGRIDEPSEKISCFLVMVFGDAG